MVAVCFKAAADVVQGGHKAVSTSIAWSMTVKGRRAYLIELTAFEDIPECSVRAKGRWLGAISDHITIVIAVIPIIGGFAQRQTPLSVMVRVRGWTTSTRS